MNRQQKFKDHQVLRRLCSCGYDPRLDKITHNCSETKALQSHVTFPSFIMLGTDRFFDLIHGNKKTLNQKRHTAILLQLVSIIDSKRGRVSWLSHNCFGELFCLQFYDCGTCCTGEMPITFSFQVLVPGYTVAVLNPTRTNDSIIVNVINYDECVIFKTDLDNIYEAADKILRDVEMTEQKQMNECFCCGKKCDTLKSCAKCKLAKYCDRVSFRLV